MIGWIYIIGYAITFRYVTGAILHEFGKDFAVDPVDVIFGLFFGLIATLFWPIIWAGRLAYVLAKKFVPSNANVIEAFFPPPKEIETKREKQQRILREEEDAHRERQREMRERERAIEARERELGIGVNR